MSRITRVRVKICGITQIEDALKAVEFGADCLGFIFANSPRRISPEGAKAIIDVLPPWVNTMGVFVDEKIENVRQIQEVCSLDYLQFHGGEGSEYCQLFGKRAIKAFRIQREKDLDQLSHYSTPAYLLDTFVKGKVGGTGQTFDLKLALSAKKYGKVILSGGLNPDNVFQAIRFVRPYAVDAGSGLETSPGKKGHGKLSSFFSSVFSACGNESSFSNSKG